MLKYVLKVHSKYYINVKIKNIQSLSTLFTKQAIQKLGYHVQGEFIELSEK